MHILVVYPYIPYPIDRGTYQQVFHLLRELARDHTIDLIALSEKGGHAEHPGIFESSCRKVVFVPFEHPPWPSLFPNRLLNSMPTTIRHWWLPQLADTIGEMLHQNKYDMVHVCDIVMAQNFLKDHQHIPLSVDRSRVDLQVLIVGKSPTEEVKAYGELPDVTVTGGMPDVQPWYRRAWAQIVLLRIGGGTRLKIPESMAMGTPVISTTIGAQGLNLAHGSDILLADTPEMFSHYTERMLHDDALRLKIGKRGMQTCRGRFGWPGLGQQLSSYYSQHFQPTKNSHEHN
ncbi:MAG: glycosyltransferase family 4 protein [Prosthecobacter sp.]|uniref:glycosyltransferase n=1 Tax=Prosthecobacter sp. TaxID=1965333 RepID=UPI0025FCC9A9|nr:glycosyltransferase [Prosthecobacter sp.]MCF7787299.1 glycosyltransferase family 4 protein [Prosthecobacter sp.]